MSEIKRSAMPLTLKLPAIIDVYEGEYPVDLAGMMPLVCIMRASAKFYDGYRRRDRRVADYHAQCNSLGIKTGLYHFLLPNNITEQAQLFLEVWDELGADLPPIVDVECDPRAFNVGFSTWTDHVKTFLDRVEAHTGRVPMIYTSAYFWNDFTLRPAWADRYPLWMAWYPFRPDELGAPPSVVIPRGWSDWALWQYHDKGRTNGIKANDLNIASDWFLAEIGGQPMPQPVPQPEPAPTIVGTVIAPRGVNVRTMPTTAGSVVGSYIQGAPLVGVEIIENSSPYRWLRLDSTHYCAVGTRDRTQTYILIDGEEPPLVPVAQNLWRVRHDATSPRWKDEPRPHTNLPAPPEVNPMYVSPNEKHGTARTPLRKYGWENYFRWLLKGDQKLFEYAIGPGRMMFNNRNNPAWEDGGDRMESLVFGGAAVTGEVEGAWLKVTMMDYEAGPPDTWPSYWDDPLKVQRACIANSKTGAVYPAPQPDTVYPMVCRQPVYIPLAWLEPFPALPMVVTVTARSLNERAEPRYGAPVVGGYMRGEPVTIAEYVLHADEVWGRTGNGWIALLYKGYEFTTWRMVTKPVV